MPRPLVLIAALVVLVAALLGWMLLSDPAADAAVAGAVRQDAPPAAVAPTPEPDLVEAGAAPGTEERARQEDPSRRAESGPRVEASGDDGRFLRILAEEDDAPLGGFGVHVLAFVDGGTHALLQSVFEADEEGRIRIEEFLIRQEGAPIEALVLLPQRRPGLRLEPERIAVVDLARGPGRTTDVRAVARPSAPIHGLAVDAATGEPLSELALRFQRWFDLHDPDASLESVRGPAGLERASFVEGTAGEWVVTDAEGRFATTEPYPPGRVGFLTIDQQRTDSTHALDVEGRGIEARFEVPVGPRLLLDLGTLDEHAPDDFVAGLWRAPEELVREDGLNEHPSPWSPDGGSRAGRWGNAMPVHAGEPPWFRVSPSQVRDAPLPTHVFVMSRDGAWFGSREIDAFEPWMQEPLHVSLRRPSSLRGVVVWPKGEPRVESADLALVDPASEWALSWRDVDRGPDVLESEVLFSLLPDGPVRLEVEAEHCEKLRLDLTLPHSGPLRLELQRADPVPTQDLTVLLRTRSGRPLDGEDGRARLQGLWLSGGGVTTSSITNVTWDAGVGRCELSDVPEGSYRISPRWAKGGFAVAYPLLSFGVPLAGGGSVYEIPIDDEVETTIFELRVVEPTVPGFAAMQVRAMLAAAPTHIGNVYGNWGSEEDPQQGLTTLPDGRRASVVRGGPYPVDATLEIQVELEGHRSPVFDQDDFQPPDANGVRLLEVVPQPGWSARIHVYEGRDEDRDGSLEGVVLAFDGVPLPPTDARGFVYAEAAERPRRLDVMTPGWALSDRASYSEWGSVRAEDGAFTIESGQLTVHLHRLGD